MCFLLFGAGIKKISYLSKIKNRIICIVEYCMMLFIRILEYSKEDKKMKRFIGMLLGVAIFVMPSFATSGKSIFKNKGCTSCHHAKIDMTGPALYKIAAIYKGREDELIKFLKGKGEPKVEPNKFTIMKPNIKDTKHLSDEELRQLVRYIIQHGN